MSRSAKRLTARLAKVPIEVRAAAAAEALLQAQRLAQVIAGAAPSDEGALRASIRVVVGKRGDRFYVRGGGPTTTRLVEAGKSATYDYALAIEHGTEKLRRRPFFYPTARKAKKWIRAGIEHEIQKAVAAFNGTGQG